MPGASVMGEEGPVGWRLDAHRGSWSLGRLPGLCGRDHGPGPGRGARWSWARGWRPGSRCRRLLLGFSPWLADGGSSVSSRGCPLCVRVLSSSSYKSTILWDQAHAGDPFSRPRLDEALSKRSHLPRPGVRPQPVGLRAVAPPTQRPGSGAQEEELQRLRVLAAVWDGALSPRVSEPATSSQAVEGVGTGDGSWDPGPFHLGLGAGEAPLPSPPLLLCRGRPGLGEPSWSPMESVQPSS